MATKHAADLHTKFVKSLDKGKLSGSALTLATLAACGSDGGSDQNTGSPDTASPTPGSNSGDLPDGAPRSVNLIINDANDTNVSAGDIDELNIVFGVNASFDAKQLAEGSVINLGLDAAAQKVASLGTVDFDDVSGSLTTLNVHASAPHVEVDFAKGNIGTLVVNLQNGTNDIVIGAGEFVSGLPLPNFSMDFLDAKTVELNHMTAGDAVIHGSVQLDHYTTDLTITTHQVGGVLDMALFAPRAAFEEGDALQTVQVFGDAGDMRIATPLDIHGEGSLVDEIDGLQHYSITGTNNAKMFLGQLGRYGLGEDLETVSINLSDGAYLGQAHILAPRAKVSELSIVTSSSANDMNIETDFATYYAQEQRVGAEHNVVMRGLRFDELSHLHIETTAGGQVVLLDTAFTVHDQVFIGSGNIIIEGSSYIDPAVGSPAVYAELPDYEPFTQLKPADATDHTGDRLFIDGILHDVFHGSTKADTIMFAIRDQGTGVSIPMGQKHYSGEYRDAGGDDFVFIERVTHPILVVDGDADTNDRVESNGDGFFSGSLHRLDFKAGSGQDEVVLVGPVAEPFGRPVLNNNVLIDFENRISGHLEVTNFLGDSAYFTVSLDGLPGITNSSADHFLPLDLATPTLIDENSIYVLEDGTPGMPSAINDYTDLTNVASVLDQMFVGTMQVGDSAVFVVHDVNNTAGKADYYFYLYNEADNGASIDAAELQHFATFDMFASSDELTAVSFA